CVWPLGCSSAGRKLVCARGRAFPCECMHHWRARLRLDDEDNLRRADLLTAGEEVDDRDGAGDVDRLAIDGDILSCGEMRAVSWGRDLERGPRDAIVPNEYRVALVCGIDFEIVARRQYRTWRTVRHFGDDSL